MKGDPVSIASSLSEHDSLTSRFKGTTQGLGRGSRAGEQPPPGKGKAQLWPGSWQGAPGESRTPASRHWVSPVFKAQCPNPALSTLKCCWCPESVEALAHVCPYVPQGPWTWFPVTRVVWQGLQPLCSPSREHQDSRPIRGHREIGMPGGQGETIKESRTVSAPRTCSVMARDQVPTPPWAAHLVQPFICVSPLVFTEPTMCQALFEMLGMQW